MTKTISINWSKISKYLETDANLIPMESGIYEILVLQTDGKYARRYVGIAEDLRKRFIEHLSKLEENENIKDGLHNYICGFDYALADSELVRKDAELGLFNKYQYGWNKVRPEGSGYYSDIVITEE
jgi:excinuclease UvrABC nuclease subunit